MQVKTSKRQASKAIGTDLLGREEVEAQCLEAEEAAALVQTLCVREHQQEVRQWVKLCGVVEDAAEEHSNLVKLQVMRRPIMSVKWQPQQLS